MKLTIEMDVKQEFLPNKRYRKNRTRIVRQLFYTEIPELNEKTFPVAFIVDDYESRIEEEGKDSIFKIWSREIRTINGRLYKALRHNDVVYKAAGWCPIDKINYLVEPRMSYYCKDDGDLFNENSSVIIGDNSNEIDDLIKEASQKYIIFENKIWKECGEPMYNMTTFGLGHNHGSTAFFVEYFYNPNIRKENYFNALEKEKAIEYAVQTALNRGDTESVEGIKNTDKNITVLMPKLVKRNPIKDHGIGDEFLNTIEDVINNSDNVNEAGILAMALSFI